MQIYDQSQKQRKLGESEVYPRHRQKSIAKCGELTCNQHDFPCYLNEIKKKEVEKYQNG